MTAAAPARRSFLVRLLLTPVGPRLLVPWRPLPPPPPHPRDIIAAADLPAPLAELTASVVGRTRLWRRERADLARELCSHFAEGLAAGRNPDQLIADFGDPARAARLIRREKRNRPLLYKAWLRAWQALALLTLLGLALYGVLALRYFTGRPTISHDYAAELTAPLAAIPASDRAWPIYERAHDALPRLPEDLARDWPTVRPSDPLWPAALSYLASAQPALALAREGAAKPRLGADPFPSAGHDALPILYRTQVDYLPHFFRVAADLHRLLRIDALRAAAAGDHGTVTADLETMLRIAGHAGEPPFLSNDSLRFSLTGSVLRTLGRLLAERPELFTDRDLATLAHRLAALDGGGPFTISTDGEIAGFRDAVQHLFTDDGRGDGRLAAFGQQQLESMTGRWYSGLPANFERVAGPVLSTAGPGRRETLDTFDRLVSAALAESSKPLYQRTEDPALLSLDTDRGLLQGVVRGMASMGAMIPDFGGMSVAAERLTQRRDATLVAIALELYRRAHGSYPKSLIELTPALLPAVPIDRFDGQPLRYRLVGGRPLIYSVGANTTDEGGTPPPPGREPWRWIPPARLRVLQANPRIASDIALGGDWILWPEPADH